MRLPLTILPSRSYLPDGLSPPSSPFEESLARPKQVPDQLGTDVYEDEVEELVIALAVDKGIGEDRLRGFEAYLGIFRVPFFLEFCGQAWH